MKDNGYKYKKILRARRKRGWTQQQLSIITRISIATIHRIENGKTQRPDNVKKVADALGIDIEELL